MLHKRPTQIPSELLALAGIVATPFHQELRSQEVRVQISLLPLHTDPDVTWPRSNASDKSTQPPLLRNLHTFCHTLATTSPSSFSPRHHTAPSYHSPCRAQVSQIRVQVSLLPLHRDILHFNLGNLLNECLCVKNYASLAIFCKIFVLWMFVFAGSNWVPSPSSGVFRVQAFHPGYAHSLPGQKGLLVARQKTTTSSLFFLVSI